MDTITPERLHRLARNLMEKTSGRGWEPPDPYHPLIVAAINAGYLRRVDGRCGVERLKDACVEWTEAGRLAVRQDSPAAPFSSQ